MTKLKELKCSDNTLQLYARANSPCRDYYALVIAENWLCLNIWKITHGPHVTPKQKFCSMEDFKYDKDLHEDLKNIFGKGVLDYVTGRSNKERKLENLPTKLFLYLLKFIDIDDILKLMRCSKILFELCNKEEVWRLIFIKKFQRIPSKEEKLLALDYSWKELFKKRLAFVQKALRESNERRKALLKKAEKTKRKTVKA